MPGDKFNPRHTISVSFPSLFKSDYDYEHKVTPDQELTLAESTVFYEASSWWPFVVTVDCTHLETMTTVVL